MQREEKIPPARHLCASPYHKGPRWMLSVFFYRHKRNKSGLQSHCATCVKIHMRPENQSEYVKEWRRNYNREYKERRRRAKGVQARQFLTPDFRAKQLVEYLDRYTTVQQTSDNNYRQTYLNGVPAETKDIRYITMLRNGSVITASFDRVDEIAIRYDLPLWEMIDAAGRMKEDIRSVRRRRAKSLAAKQVTNNSSQSGDNNSPHEPNSNRPPCQISSPGAKIIESVTETG